MKEINVRNRIRLAAGKIPGLILFNNPCGVGWVGEQLKYLPGEMLILGAPRKITYGLAPGSADLIGWESVVITPQMVGSQIARFVGAEIKAAKGRVSQSQAQFLAAVSAAGGRAEVLRSEEDLLGAFLL